MTRELMKKIEMRVEPYDRLSIALSVIVTSATIWIIAYLIDFDNLPPGKVHEFSWIMIVALFPIFYGSAKLVDSLLSLFINRERR